MHNLIVVHQQNRQKVKEQEMHQKMIEQNAQGYAVEESGSIRMRSEIDEIDSTDHLAPLCVSDEELNSPVLSQNAQPHRRQHNNKRMNIPSNGKIDSEPSGQVRKVSRRPWQTKQEDKSQGSLRKKKQVRFNEPVKICNSAVDRKNLPTFSCAECSKKFNYKCNLIKHLRIHTGKKPFSCGECGATFSDSSNFTKHQAIHRSAKPFKCLICGGTFKRKANLAQHPNNKSYSTKLSIPLHCKVDEKPFVSNICKAQFIQKTFLSNHMNIHTGKRPYECIVCRMTFRQSSNFYKHRKIHAEKQAITEGRQKNL